MCCCVSKKLLPIRKPRRRITKWKRFENRQTTKKFLMSNQMQVISSIVAVWIQFVAEKISFQWKIEIYLMFSMFFIRFMPHVDNTANFLPPSIYNYNIIHNIPPLLILFRYLLCLLVTSPQFTLFLERIYLSSKSNVI